MSNHKLNEIKKKKRITKSPYFNCQSNKNKSVVDHPCHSFVDRGLRLSASFFDISCVELAKSLLGKVLVRVMKNGTVFKGCIVETESYLGGEDKASFTYKGKISERSKPMYMQPGTLFVYITYGMYNLLNISSHGYGAAVLLRALHPIEGIDQMKINRNNFQQKKGKPKSCSKQIPVHQLCNGPAKLCISLDITKDQCNMQDLSTWNEMWVEPGATIPEDQIVKTCRVGIESAGSEWANKHLRFYVLNNKSVSRRDKSQEMCLLNKTEKYTVE